MCTSSQNHHANQPVSFSLPNLGDGAAAADGRHLAQIDVREGLARPALEIVPNHVGDVLTLLHGDQRHARQRFAVAPRSWTCRRRRRLPDVLEW